MNELHTKSFIARLNEKQQQIQESANNRSLPNRVTEWLYHLPENQRRQDYSMAELATLFATNSQVLGPTLLSLGWRRVRSWQEGKPYRRSWQPPTIMNS